MIRKWKIEFMEKKDRMKKQKWMYFIFWFAMAAGIFVILNRVGYSDGDDTYFYEHTRAMGFFEYLIWRYQTWVGRMAGEALVYLAFHLGLGFWRVMEALMMVLLPAGILELACKTAGYRGYFDLVQQREEDRMPIRYPFFLACGYFLMSVMTLGYAAVWVNGSIFYTWTFTAGVWAMMPLADAAFETGAFSKKQLIYALPCSVIAAMSIEQMGAVLIAFEGLAIFGMMFAVQENLHIRRKDAGKVPSTIWIQFAVTLVAFVLLFLAPGNSIRVETEIAAWMPGYGELTTGGHLFLTLQWILSSFANESRAIFVGMWVVGLVLYKGKNRLLKILAILFSVIGILPYIFGNNMSEMELGGIDIEQCLYEIPTWQAMTTQNRVNLFVWLAAVVFTLVFLWHVSERSIFVVMVYLGGIASEAILYFSPTIYASGARVYYLTDLMYIFLILWMLLRIKSEKKKNILVIGLFLLGIVNFLSQYSVMLLQL